MKYCHRYECKWNIQSVCEGSESCTNDLISRQAVLKKIKEVCLSKEQKWIDFRALQGSNGQRDLIINFIETLPSVSTEKTKWIPVSERLPEDDEIVIVSITDDSGDSEYRYTSCAWYYNGIWVMDNERISSSFVKAWMPLPQPYKEESEE